MKEIITITGEVGSGKSTVGRMLATWLAYEHISTGTIQRRFAAERGCTPLELNEASMRDGKIDEVIDSYLRGLNQSGNRLVLDSRLAWHFVERAFNVFLYVDPCAGARRVLASGRKEEIHCGLADAVRNDLRRKQLEDERFARLYGVQCNDPDNYDLLIDSTWAEPETVAATIRERFQKGVSRFGARALLCPKSLYPSVDVGRAASEETKAILASIESGGFFPHEPIEVVRFSQYYFILDGHRRASCALRAGLEYVPCAIRRAHDQHAVTGLTFGEEIAASLDHSWISDWEDAHKFSFASYPDSSGNPRL